MFKVSSIFVIIGTAPTSRIASIVAIKLNPCVITSSPGLTPIAFKAIFIAAVPELTHCTKSVRKKLANFFSNILILNIPFLLLSKA